MRTPNTLRRGFSLTELLVVMGILTVLAGMLLPLGHRVREVARRTKCMGHARSLALATDVYREDHRGWYPPIWSGTTRWMHLLKEYVENCCVFDCPSSEHIQCPVDPEIYLGYGMNIYNFGGLCLYYGVPADAVEVPSRTILLGDSEDGKYYVGSGVRFCDPVQHVAYRHSAGFVAGFFDNHAEHLHRTTKDLWAIAKIDR